MSENIFREEATMIIKGNFIQNLCLLGGVIFPFKLVERTFPFILILRNSDLSHFQKRALLSCVRKHRI